MNNMENGEAAELTDQTLLPDNSSFTKLLHEETSTGLLVAENLKKAQTCTHTHTCNPPGPDHAVHSHTCYHSHTHLFTTKDDGETKSKQDSSSKLKRASGNREAVRKYRVKKKTHTTYLEEQVKELRVVNQELVKKLQDQTMLEAEVVRLRSLLGDLRGKLDTEFGVIHWFHERSCSTSTFKEGNCRLQPDTVGSITIGLDGCAPCPHSPPPPLPLPLHATSSIQLQVGSTIGTINNREGETTSCQANQDRVVAKELAAMDVNTHAKEALVSSDGKGGKFNS